jgi:hypothetical protein
VEILLKKADKVRERVQDMENAQNKDQLLKTSHNLEVELKELTEMTKKRLRDMKDPSTQDDLQAAVAMLKITTPIMVASSKVTKKSLVLWKNILKFLFKAFIEHPRMEGLRVNQQYAVEEINRALDCFCDAVQGEQPQDELAISQHGKINELAENFEKFQVKDEKLF